jgi:curved DNA-binding protein CbpA
MANEMSRERCLEVLGLKPGASAQELKAAYRDMAKVWHPDRFTHDPRLQQKAQEKLKEINDAYQQMLAGRFDSRRAHTPDDQPRAARTHGATDAADATHARQAQYTQYGTRETSVAVRPASRKVGRLVLVPALAFCATFAVVTPRLLSSRRSAPPPAEESAAAQPPREAQTDEARDQSDNASAQKNARKLAQIEEARRANSSGYPGGVAPPIPTSARALPTVTVSVDPSTGLLARSDCPHKMAMTFPAGDEPRAHCNAEHRAAASQQPATEDAAREKKSRLKSFAGRLASPTEWFGNGSQTEPAKKRPTPGDQ